MCVLHTYIHHIIENISPPQKKSNFNDLSLASVGLEKKIIDKQPVALHVSNTIHFQLSDISQKKREV